MITRHAIIHGRVQGVFFRGYTQEMALSYGLTGWVRNLQDGSVEAVLCGKKEMVNSMLARLRQGPPLSRVDSIMVDDAELNEIFSTFEVRY